MSYEQKKRATANLQNYLLEQLWDLDFFIATELIVEFQVRDQLERKIVDKN